MWIRFNIECHNCKKITNTRFHIISRKKQNINYDCPNCNSRVTAELHLHHDEDNVAKLEKITNEFDAIKALLTLSINTKYSMELFRGVKVPDNAKADYYLEYSDITPTKGISTTPHGKLGFTPSLRDFEDYKNSKTINEIRNLFPEDNWREVEDIIKAFLNQNLNVVKAIAKRLGRNHIRFIDDSYLSYLSAYFTIINVYFQLFINIEKYHNYIQYLNSKIFDTDNKMMIDGISELVVDYVNENEWKKFLTSISYILLKFVKNKQLFVYTTNTDYEYQNSFYNKCDFESLKSLYSDIFEFLGRWSVLILKIDNLINRGDLRNLPNGLPKDIVNINDFKRLSNGRKKPILTNCLSSPFEDFYNNSFDVQLRNGINHFKTTWNNKNQSISYYPYTNNPERKITITYKVFLRKIIDGLTQSIKTFQLMKFLIYHRELKMKNITPNKTSTPKT